MNVIFSSKFCAYANNSGSNLDLHITDFNHSTCLTFQCDTGSALHEAALFGKTSVVSLLVSHSEYFFYVLNLSRFTMNGV